MHIVKSKDYKNCYQYRVESFEDAFGFRYHKIMDITKYHYPSEESLFLRVWANFKRRNELSARNP